MAFLGNFNANDVEPSAPQSFEPIPAGDYVVQILQSEMKETSTGGQMLVLEMEITEGEYRSRRLWDRLNLVNQNQQAQEIAHRTLSSICRAVNQMQVSDSEQLHFKPMVATVRVRPAGLDKKGVHREAANEIRGYAAVNASRAGGSMPPRQPNAAPASPPAQKVPAWRQNRPAA